MFLHLFQHLQKNDRNILRLLTCENNELFLAYFKENLKKLIEKVLLTFAESKPTDLPDSFWVNHIAATFVETVKWWVDNGMQESPEMLADYFNKVL